MRTLCTGVILGALIAIAGCIEHRPEDGRAVAEPKTDSVRPRLNGRDFKGLRVYEGVIPCTDCSGIYQRLALKGDSIGVFRLTETYRDANENGDGIVVTTGSWKQYVSAQGKTLFYLSEGTLGDSSRTQRYEVLDNSIVQLDLNGSAVDSTKDYTLKLISSSKN